MDEIELFLAHADDHRPVLAEGLPLESLTDAPRPPPEPPPRYLRYDTGDVHSLPQQRWALVVPEGPVGDRLLGAVAPLHRARREAQEADVRVYRVPAGLGPVEATRWKEQVYEDEAVLPEHRPRYLLILGDADQVSWDLQHRLATDTFVGRLAFPGERSYEAYVDKVLRWERTPPAPGARALFCSVNDGTTATTLGHRMLMQPTVARVNERKARGTVPVTEIVALEGSSASSPDALVEQAARREPTILLSMSHGLGAPVRGWASADEQRALQGAMSFGPGQSLVAADLGSRPFLPGGAWLFFACYSAGTPAASVYYRWLLVLQLTGMYRGRVGAVLAGLPREGDRPFVAALPQAVLENPDGPLAVIGHVDLLWAFSYLDTETPGGSRAGRFQDLVRALADGGRAGAASYELLRFWSGADAHLSMLYGDDDRPKDEAKRALKARLWMLRNDLRGYVLLGDPAARLAVAPETPETREPGGALTADVRPQQRRGARTVAGPASVHDPKQMEKVVLEALLGKELHSNIARRAGIEKSELQRWVDAYQEAGRAALAKMR
ncbi:hypothetical protein [Sorangium sp. So ce1389]|uniref:hypothetical protein n=1 Tax=Sorangium sp. So ce1389 TaxID=3133336 RepID=UPI003F5F55F7